MMLRKITVTILAMLFISSMSFANEFRTKFENKQNSIAVLGITSSFQTDEGTITGSGIGVDFAHAFNDNLTMDVSISTALSQGEGVSSSFTGVTGFVYYNFLSACCDKYKTVSVSNVPVFTETVLSPYLLQVGAGINQYFLNGSRGVYSSSGLGVGANFFFRAWNYQVKLSGRVSQMTTNEMQVQGMYLGAGLVFPL